MSAGDHLLTTGGQTYRVAAGVDDEVEDIIEWLTYKASGSAAMHAMSRQQVCARIGRHTLPADFPDADVVIGDEARDAGHVRGWLEATVTAWEDEQIAEAEADGPAPAGTAPAETPGEDPGGPWPLKSRQWTGIPITVDNRVVFVTSRGVITPSGDVQAGPMPSGEALGAFIRWKWPRKPKYLPQLWISYEALDGIGFPLDLSDESPGEIGDIVASTFGCEVSWSQSGWFTCTFSGGEDGERHVIHLVLMPLLYLDPPDKRPGDMGVAGWQNTATEIPEGEIEAVKLLADRITWLATLADGIVPASRWTTVGANLLDAVRRRGRSKPIEGCPLPVEVVVEAGSEFEPNLPPTWDKRDKKARGDRLDVMVDQRAAFLASASQVELGYGTPKELKRIDTSVFNAQKPPYGLWRINVPPATQLDGLTKLLPLPHPSMRWDAPTTFWITTRAIQHLTAPIESGGAGMGVGELDITSAWVWPHQGRMLRTWADVLRSKLLDAYAAEREDQIDFIKGIYTAYLGRMASDKWSPKQRHHQQPAWYATIRADTRFRNLRYARRIADTHNLFPVVAELDAWIYRLPHDVEPSILEEDSTANGKMRIKWTSAEDTGAPADGDVEAAAAP